MSMMRYYFQLRFANWKKQFKILTWVFTIVFANSAIAIEDVEDIFSLSLEELLQVKITGSTLTEKNIQTVPAAVTIFRQEEIQRMGLDSLEELMNLVPGFQSYRTSISSAAYPFSSRGRRISSASSEVLIMIDGNRLEDARTSGSALIVPKIPLINIERVEFIRGPGAAIYGSNAMMGVINIITRSNVKEARLSVGSFSRRKVSLLNSLALGKTKIDFLAHFDVDNGDDYQLQDTFSANRIDSDDPRQFADFNIKINWRKTQIQLQHNQYKSDNFYELEKISNGFSSRSGQVSAVFLKHEFDWQSISSWIWLGYSLGTFKTSAQLTPTSAFVSVSSPSSNEALFVSAKFNDLTNTRFQWHNDWGINAKSSLQFGLELRRISKPETSMSSNFDLGDVVNAKNPVRFYGRLLATTAVETRSTRDIIGLYSQYQYRLFDTDHLTMGIRYDRFSNIGSEVSPRFAYVKEINKHHALKFILSHAFRAPNEVELTLLNNPVLLGNPNLKPETVQSRDIIWTGQWSHTGFSLGYFESRFKNAIVETANSSGVRQFENIVQAPIKGFEFELSHELNEQWLLRTTYMYLREKADLSFREASHQASLMVNFQRNKWNANLIVTGSGKREMSFGGSNDNRITLDKYIQVFSKVSYRFSPQWQGFVQGKNILNEKFLTPTASTSLTEGVPNRGREILIGTTWRY